MPVLWQRVATDDNLEDVPVGPFGEAQVNDVRRFESSAVSHLREFHGEVFVNEKARRRQAPCLAMVRTERGRLIRQDGFRGRPRRGCDFT